MDLSENKIKSIYNRHINSFGNLRDIENVLNRLKERGRLEELSDSCQNLYGTHDFNRELTVSTKFVSEPNQNESIKTVKIKLLIC
jgi:tRNA U38,U39,U40 pseudouridine synthase TruA